MGASCSLSLAAASTVLTVLLSGNLAHAGCTRDSDCRGDHICEAGTCIALTFSGPPLPMPRQPRIDDRYVVCGLEARPVKSNDESIGKLQRLIRITDDADPEKPALLFRLAESYAEKQRYYTLRALEMDEKIAAARNASDKQRLLSEKKGYEAQEDRWYGEARKVYVEIVDSPKYKKYPRQDEVLFHLAHMLQEVRREAEARVFYQRLFKDHPSSKLIPNAYMAFGVYYFQVCGSSDHARRLFDRVTQFRESCVYPYAMYLKAWTWYNLSQHRRSLETFEQLIEALRKAGRTPQSEQLLADARTSMLLPYSRNEPLADGAARAWDYLKRHGRAMAPQLADLLARIYESHKHPALAAQVRRAARIPR